MPKQAGESSATGKLGLFELVNSFTGDGDWEGRTLVIYRNDVRVQDALKAKHNGAYTDTCKGPFTDDEAFSRDYIQEHWGGGNFRILLRNDAIPRQDHIEAKVNSLLIEGLPKWSSRELQAQVPKLLGVEGEPEEEEEEGDAPAHGTYDAPIVERLLDKVDTMQERMLEIVSQRSDPEREATGKAMEIMAEATKKGISTIMDSIPKQNPQDQTEQLKAMMGLVREMFPRQETLSMADVLKLAKELAGEQKKGMDWSGILTGATALLGAAPQIVEGLRAIGINFGGGAAMAAAEPDRVLAYLDLAKQALPQLPALLQMLKMQAQPHPPQPQPQPVASPALAGTEPVPAPAPAPAPQQDVEALMWQKFAASLVKAYFETKDPVFCADLVRLSWPEQAQQLAAILQSHGEWWTNPTVLQQVGQFLPALAPVLSDGDFPVWAAKWWSYLLNPNQADEETQG